MNEITLKIKNPVLLQLCKDHKVKNMHKDNFGNIYSEIELYETYIASLEPKGGSITEWFYELITKCKLCSKKAAIDILSKKDQIDPATISSVISFKVNDPYDLSFNFYYEERREGSTVTIYELDKCKWDEIWNYVDKSFLLKLNNNAPLDSWDPRNMPFYRYLEECHEHSYSHPLFRNVLLAYGNIDGKDLSKAKSDSYKLK